MKLILSTLTLVALISGCADLPARIPDSLQPGDGEHGYIIGSIGIKTAGHNQNKFELSQIHIRKKGETDGITIPFRQPGIIHTPDTDDKNHEVTKKFILKVKPGNYEIYNASFKYDGSLYKRFFYSRRKFSIPITVKKNKASYIGKFIAHAYKVKGRIKDNFPYFGYFMRSDQLSSDIKILLAKDKALSEENINKSVIRLDAAPLIFKSYYKKRPDLIEKAMIRQEKWISEKQW